MNTSAADCRHLLGDSLADSLGVPRSQERFLLPAAIATVRALERARRRSPRLEQRLVVEGDRYWDAVLEKGLVYATSDFAIPSRLG